MRIIGIMSAAQAIKAIVATVLVAVCVSPAAADECADRPTGFLPPPNGGAVVRKIEPAGKIALLRGTAKSALPSKWDSREYGWIPPIRNQGQVGSCWSFAALSTLEIQLLKAGKGKYDFSEKNMVNLNGWNLTPNQGGNSDMAAAYLTRWQGPVAETNDVYKSSIFAWTDSPELMPIARVQHVVWIAPLDGSDDRVEALKSAITNYGAVATATYWNSAAHEKGSAYYCPTNAALNHAVTLVGWDDDYPVLSFKTEPPGPGAWIMRNSWGTSYGDHGYNYVSYYDANMAHVYSGAVFIPAGENENFDAVRGHARLGPVFSYNSDTSSYNYRYQASVFTAAWNERLDAVGVWSAIYPNEYEISVYTNVTRGGTSPIQGGVLATSQTGKLAHAGFTTIPLDHPVELEDGSSFAVIYRQCGTVYSLCVDGFVEDYCNPEHLSGDSFFGKRNYKGNIVWCDGSTADKNWGSTIMAYTRAIDPARGGDAPGETEFGADYLSELAVTNSVLYADTLGTFGASAGIVGANGRSLWSSWLAGLDPTNHDSGKLELSIDMVDGVPQVSWEPDLGDRRRYVIYGRATMDASDDWTIVDKEDLGTSGKRFFKIALENNTEAQ